MLPDMSISFRQKSIKMPKLKSSNETFRVNFKQCEHAGNDDNSY